MASNKVSFGFKKPINTTQVASSSRPFGFKLSAPSSKPTNAAPTAHSFDEEEAEADEIVPTGSTSSAVPASRRSQQVTQSALSVDESIFDYDGAFDRMEQAKRQIKAQKDVAKAERKPKYIGAFIEAASLRKRDHARAEAKMIQREREKEGDAYDGVEAFVTDAYREQLEQIKEAEEREKREEEEMREKGAKSGMGKGASRFLGEMMKMEDREHEAVMQAASAALGKGKAQATQSQASQLEHTKSDLEKARDAQAKGLQAELNDEGELVDRTGVLSAGLNVVRPEDGKPDMNRIRDRNADLLAATGSSVSGSRTFDGGRSGRGDARRDQRARQTRLIEEQMLEQERLRAEQEEKEREERKKRLMGIDESDQAQVKAREDKIQALKARALERKRKREEEQAQG